AIATPGQGAIRRSLVVWGLKACVLWPFSSHVAEETRPARDRGHTPPLFPAGSALLRCQSMPCLRAPYAILRIAFPPRGPWPAGRAGCPGPCPPYPLVRHQRLRGDARAARGWAADHCATRAATAHPPQLPGAGATPHCRAALASGTLRRNPSATLLTGLGC